MMRNIHFFDFKARVDPDEAIKAWSKVEDYLKSSGGCLERRTMKLLDSKLKGEAVPAAGYINESLWPNKETAQAAFKNMPEDLKAVNRAFIDQLEIEKTVRYVDL